MQKNIARHLKAAYDKKERAEALIHKVVNLEQSAAGSHQMTYNAIKQEYFDSRDQSLREIEALKKMVSDELGQKKKANDIYGEELMYLDTRYKVGQLKPSQYLKKSKTLSSKVSELKHEMANLQVIMSVSSADELLQTGALHKRSFWSFLLSLIFRKKKLSLMPPKPQLRLPAPIDFDAVRRESLGETPPESLNADQTIDHMTCNADPSAPDDVTSPSSPETSGFFFRSLSIEPGTIKIDDEALIKAVIHNPSHDKKIGTFDLIINGSKEGMVTVDIEPGEDKEVIFKLSFGEQGQYAISFGSLSIMTAVEV